MDSTITVPVINLSSDFTNFRFQFIVWLHILFSVEYYFSWTFEFGQTGSLCNTHLFVHMNFVFNPIEKLAEARMVFFINSNIGLVQSHCQQAEIVHITCYREQFAVGESTNINYIAYEIEYIQFICNRRSRYDAVLHTHSIFHIKTQYFFYS